MDDPSPFILPKDGWFHIAAFGEWPHKPTGLTQIIDDVCADEIIKAFTEFKAAPNWPGVLIDFDHQSLDIDKPTVAAGWIADLQKRDSGLWAQVRWSDIGRQSIEGGRYRFISPVWRSSDCKKLDGDRIRPMKLMNCAVTNDPNIRGLFPLSNAAGAADQISAPPMDIRPTPGVPPSPTQTAPPRKAISIPAPFSTAVIANRTPWGPAETRARYRHAMANAFRSDEQRRWFYAQQDKGGADPAGEGSPASFGYGPTTPYVAPETAPQVPNPYTEQARGFRAERVALEQSLTPPPEPSAGFNPIDVAAAVKAAMSKPGATATDVIRAREDAKAENDRRKKAWAAVEKYYSTAYKDKAAGKRALDKYTARLENQYKSDLAKWEVDTGKIRRAIAELDTKIAVADEKAKLHDFKADQDAKAQAQKAQAQKLKEWVATQKELRAQDAARQKAERAEAMRPVQDAKAEAAKPMLFWKLLSQGNKAAAMQIYPNVNYAAAVAEYAAASKKVGPYDKAAAAAMRAELNNTPPPQGS